MYEQSIIVCMRVRACVCVIVRILINPVNRTRRKDGSTVEMTSRYSDGAHSAISRFENESRVADFNEIKVILSLMTMTTMIARMLRWTVLG